MVKSLTIGLVDDGVATWNPVSDGNLLVTGAIAFIITLFAALSAFVCARLEFGVPWLPSGLHVVSVSGGLVAAFSLASVDIRDDIRRLGRSIDAAGQSGRK